MTSRLSISKAWDETKARLARDGRLLLAVALALIALPGAIGEFLTPQARAGTGASPVWIALLIVVTVIGVIGQLAIVRLSYGSSVTVGEAIAHGARRSLSYIGAALLILIGMLLLMIPFAAVGAAAGVTFQPSARPSGVAVLLALLFAAVAIYFGVRFILGAPVASAEHAGPLTILKRSWQLTSSYVWRLIGFVLLFVIGAVIALRAIAIVAGLLANVMVGTVEPMSASALIVVLVNALASAVATTIFAVMITRLYVQLAGDPGTEVSVPSSGT